MKRQSYPIPYKLKFSESQDWKTVALMTFQTQLSDFLKGFIPNGDGAEDKMVPPHISKSLNSIPISLSSSDAIINKRGIFI